ncbi:hypothetical protein TrLO_g9734, partial [Triparma laevis f. longispina]
MRGQTFAVALFLLNILLCTSSSPPGPPSGSNGYGYNLPLVGNGIDFLSQQNQYISYSFKAATFIYVYFKVYTHIRPRSSSKPEFSDPKLSQYTYNLITRPSDLWDLIVSSGLLTVYVLGNLKRVRSDYGTLGQALRWIPGRQRKTYYPEEELELKCKIVGFFIGAFLGYGVTSRIWGVPDYFGALGGGGFWVSVSSFDSKYGDLTRLTSRKVLEVLGICGRLEKEVYLIRKGARVSKNFVAMVTLMDGRFRIMERVGGVLGRVTG